jgi:hypothetical protein
LALGAAFLRAARLIFLRSSLSVILVVSATCNLFQSCVFNVSHSRGMLCLEDSRDWVRFKTEAAR